MRIKQILPDVRLVIADLEVRLNGTLRSSLRCAVVKAGQDGADQVVPLNTPDGRPILMNLDNAIAPAK
jgi:hypothetical protein